MLAFDVIRVSSTFRHRMQGCIMVSSARGHVTVCVQCCKSLRANDPFEPFVKLDPDGEMVHVAVCFPCLDLAEHAWLEDTNEYLAESFEHMSSDIFSDSIS